MSNENKFTANVSVFEDGTEPDTFDGQLLPVLECNAENDQSTCGFTNSDTADFGLSGAKKRNGTIVKWARYL